MKKAKKQKQLAVQPAQTSRRKKTNRPADVRDMWGGYEFVLLVNPATYQANWLGGRHRPVAGLYQQEPHAQALQTAVKQGMYHYEWIGTRRGQANLYQTTCVTLRSAEGTVDGVLSFSRNITHRMQAYGTDQTDGLRDFSAPRTFSQILLASRETEKKEISKALHDEIGSSAVMLTALLSLVRASVKSGHKNQALQDLAQLDSQLKESLERMKNIVVSMRPPRLENKGGLGGALRDLLDNISALGHLSYTFDYEESAESVHLSDDVKILLYRIVQEALTNTVKHARAKRVHVALKQAGANIRLTVTDDGVGFRPGRQRSIEHVGLLAMRDSVELLGGGISIKSAPGKGTRIEVICPRVVYGGK